MLFSNKARWFDLQKIVIGEGFDWDNESIRCCVTPLKG